MKARRIDYRRVPELAAAGLPYDSIAKEIGCSYSVLTVYCRKHGIAVVSGVRLGYFSSEKDAVAAQVAYCEANGITLVETKGAAGSGRGWTYRPGGGKRPYQVVLAGKYIGVYATESEAVSAYKAAAHDLRMANAFLPAPAQQEAS